MADDAPDDADSPDASAASSAPPSPPPPGGGPPGGTPGGGTLPPQGAAAAQQPSALGRQAMARAQGRLIVHALHTRLFPSFELNSPEGKAIHKAIAALAPVFGSGGEDEKGKNDAMAALMQRALAAKMQGGGGPPGGAPPGGGQPGMAAPNRGPIPSTTGGGQ